MKLARSFISLGLLAVVASVATAQSTTTNLVPAHDSLLPPSFGSWQTATPASAPDEPAMSLVNANKAALAEDNPQRSQVSDFQNADGKLHVEAVQFADFSGAFAAFTLLRTSGSADDKLLGAHSAYADGALLFQQGSVVVLAFPVARDTGSTTKDEARIRDLKALAASLPAVRGAQALPPLLPNVPPGKWLLPGSVRYALGPATYSAQGGVLPAANLGWDKSAEAVTAAYKDKHGEETLTLLLYPTPQIADANLKHLNGIFPGLGSKFTEVSARRDGTLVLVASGTYPREVATKFIAGIHLKMMATTDAGAPPPEFQSEVRKTASLLANIAVLAGILCSAAVLLGLFLGGGRAAIRVLRGKPAAVEPEFLRLHLANQNAPPKFQKENSQAAPEKPKENGE